MSNQVRVFLTAPEFIKWINETFPKSVDDKRTDEEYALWAVCLQEAHALFDSYSTKDVAALFLEGLPAKAAHPIQSIQDWLDTIYVDLLESDEDSVVDGFISQDTADAFAITNVVEVVTADYSSNR